MKADLVFINGEVITMDADSRIEEAVAIKENRIIFVGSTLEVQQMIDSKTEIIDLCGKSLLPGFIDAHIHLVMYGLNQLAISCKAHNITSNEDIKQELRKKVQTVPKGQWIRAWGFNETTIKENRYLSIKELDEISTEHPIMITRTCGHISIVNSKALELAEIDANTSNPDGGIIERDTNGALTGKLIEKANMRMNEIAKYTEVELRQAMKIASDHFVQAGITSIHEAGVSDTDTYRLLQEAVKNKDIAVRVYAIICTLNNSHEFVGKMLSAGVLTGTGDERFKIGPAKIFTDGSSTGPTIATREPYTSNPNDHGILYYSEEEIYRVLGEAHKKGYQITVHAQGDRAIEMYLNCVEKALNEHPREDHRHRIEHAGISTPDLQDRMKNLGVIPIPNPPFHFEFGDIYVKNYGERVNYMYPVRDFIDKGIICAGGSDAPVTDYNPLLGIHTAVNRISSSNSEIGVNQKVTILEAIKIYTINGAYASFEEDIKGSLEVGKLADLVVLDNSILSQNNHSIKDLKVEMTIIDGKILYKNEALVKA
ncbi:amidohydrolase [Lysinibacillus sp. fls2-241-R2A-57]|uniref:amidohydrolase n=1 Tax=Lysinibacillus sp. fls2-241-R2A-57 TaxID=3040292 RepID=UPI002552224A|nr:amidohydrolase [Lysinibacillus sp. fls2-241-R2A-57]